MDTRRSDVQINEQILALKLATNKLEAAYKGHIWKENPLNSSLLTPSSPGVPWTWTPWMRQHLLQLQEAKEALRSRLRQRQEVKKLCSCLPDTWHSGISVTGVTGFLVTCPPGSGNPATGQVHGAFHLMYTSLY